MNTIKVRDAQNKKSKVFISFVLDESSSMSVGREAIISGMNEHIQTLKNKFNVEGIEPVVTFVKFSDVVRPLYEGKTLSDLAEFQPHHYSPNGMTALYDAVGYTIDKVQSFDGINDDGNSSLLIVVTDGEENSSRQFNSSQISEKIKTLNNSGKWTITYLGPNNVDLTKVQKDTGMKAGNTYGAVLNDNASYRTAFKGINASLSCYADNAVMAVVSGCSFSTNDFYSVGSSIISGGTDAVSSTASDNAIDTKAIDNDTKRPSFKKKNSKV